MIQLNQFDVITISLVQGIDTVRTLEFKINEMICHWIGPPRFQNSDKNTSATKQCVVSLEAKTSENMVSGNFSLESKVMLCKLRFFKI